MRFQFDFNDTPHRIYGIWPLTPFPIEVSIYGVCSHQCCYCFSNLGRMGADRKPHTKNSLPTLINALEKARRDEYDPIGFFLREKYPICFSNTTDPFMPQEKTFRCTEAFMKYCKANDLPLFVMTKGSVLWEEKERYINYLVPGKDVVYITLTTLDDDLIKKIEPNAPTATERLKLCEYLTEHNIPVIFAPNPYWPKWIPDIDKYVATVKAAGARGLWESPLHFNETQSKMIDPAFADLPSEVAKYDAPHIYGDMKRWYIATESTGLDLFTPPEYAAYFGHRERHYEATDPAWVGGNVFSHVLNLGKFITRLAYGGRDAYDAQMKPQQADYIVVYSWGALNDF